MAQNMIETWRGAFLENQHSGDAVVMHKTAGLIAGWGEPDVKILPRSALKLIQAVPLIESGALGKTNLDQRALALACASHAGEGFHVDYIQEWLSAIELSEAHLQCGMSWPDNKKSGAILASEGKRPDQRHNACSGKHTGFLTLAKHLGADLDYIDPDHVVQQSIRARLAELADEEITGFAIDGCSAPNFGLSLSGFARAAVRLCEARMLPMLEAINAYPDYIAGTGRACSELTQAIQGLGVVKFGADGVYLAILPEKEISVALKVHDGSVRAAETAIAEILVKLDAVDPDDPRVIARRHAPLINLAKRHVGQTRPSEAFTNFKI